MAEDNNLKYYWYYYNLFGAPASGKRTSDTPKTPNTVQEHEITMEEFYYASFGRLAAKYPFKGTETLT